MPVDTPAARRLVREFALAELLTDVLGWTPCHAEPPAHRALPLEPIAARAGRTALHHRTPLGADFPGYAERRALRARAAERYAAPLIVFTDALHTVQLWQWREPAPGRPALYREHCHRAGDSGAELVARLAKLDGDEASEPMPGAVRDAVEPAVLLALLRAVRRRCPAAFRAGAEADRVLAREAPLGERVLTLIEETDDAALLRAVWRALTTLSVLDPACGRGDRLLAALAVLEPQRDACLERMRSWIADHDRTRAARRPERSAAMRAALARAAADSPAVRAVTIRAAIVRDNLFGADVRPERVAECARRLQRAVAGAAPAVANAGPDPAAAALRTGDAGLGYRRAAEIGDALLRGDVELLGRAAAVATSTEPGAAFIARQAALRAVLDRRLAAEHGVDPIDAAALAAWLEARRPLHACLEWPAVARRGGFDVVLDGRGGRVVRERRAGFGAVRPAPLERLCFLPHGSAAYPARLAARLGEAAPALLTLRGDPALLGVPLLALFASVEVPAGAALQTLELARALREAGVAVVSGFQSPLERACLELLLGGTQPVVLCAARGIDEVRLPALWRAPLEAGRLLLISGFAPSLRRPTRELADLRNRHVAALAERVLIAHAVPGGKTHRLAAELLRRDAPVHALDDEANADLLLLGAQPVDASRAVELRAAPTAPRQRA